MFCLEYVRYRSPVTFVILFVIYCDRDDVGSVLLIGSFAISVQNNMGVVHFSGIKTKIQRYGNCNVGSKGF